MARLGDFKAVHDGKGDYTEAFAVLRESLGISEELLSLYVNWVIEYFGVDGEDDYLITGALWGLVTGLVVAENGAS